MIASKANVGFDLLGKVERGTMAKKYAFANVAEVKVGEYVGTTNLITVDLDFDPKFVWINSLVTGVVPGALTGWAFNTTNKAGVSYLMDTDIAKATDSQG